MAIKLGELLIREGLINPDQLDEALKNQVIFGGRLGTNLLEIGAVSEEDIAKVLSKKLGVPFVGTDELTKIPEEVIHAIPRALVEKYRVVPVRLDKRRLTLVMANPTDLKAIDEIAFRTGYIIRPVLAPDVRLNWAMEKYYDMAVKVRYVRTTHKPEQKKLKPISFLPVGEPVLSPEDLEGKPASPAPKEEPLEELEELVEEPEEFQAEGETVDFTSFESLPWEKVLHRPEKRAAVPTPPEAQADVAPPEPAPAEPHAAETVLSRLTEATDREDIADTLGGYLAGEFAHVALFVVRGGAAHGWRCFLEKTLHPPIEQFKVPLNEPSVLQMVATSKTFYLGPVVRTPFNSSLIQELGGSMPRMVLVVPIVMMNRVVGLIYVDDDGQNLTGRLPELQKLAAKASMAFDILILKSKILTT